MNENLGVSPEWLLILGELERQEGKQREIPMSPEQLEGLQMKEAKQSYYIRTFGAEEALLKREEKKPPIIDYDNLYEAMASATPKQRLCMYLYFWTQKSPRKIAKLLGISRTTAKRRLRAAVARTSKNYVGTKRTGSQGAHKGGEVRFLSIQEPIVEQGEKENVAV